MKKSISKISILKNDTPNPLDPEDSYDWREAIECRKKKYKAHAVMISKLQKDPRFDYEIFTKVIKDVERKFIITRQLHAALGGKMQEKFPLELTEFIINYLIDSDIISI